MSSRTNLSLKLLKMSDSKDAPELEQPLTAGTNTSKESSPDELHVLDQTPTSSPRSGSTRSDPTDLISLQLSSPVTPAHSASFTQPSPRKEIVTEGRQDPSAHVKQKSGRKERVTWAGIKEGQSQRPRVVVSNSPARPLNIQYGHGQQNGRGMDGTHLDPGRTHRHYQEYVPGGMYVLYEEEPEDNMRRGGPVQSPVSYYGESYYGERASSRSTRTTGDTNNTFIGEIDGRFSFSEGDGGDYIRVENINSDSGMSTSQELLKCKQTVLKPYHIFLKLIGWRRVRESHHDRRRNCAIQCCNIGYPMFIFTMLVLTIISQILTCFSRDTPARFPGSGDGTYVYIQCADNVVVNQAIPGLLILSAYLYGVYIFRYGEPEHLASLMETVFLSYNPQFVKTKTRNIINVLRFFLAFTSLWILFDFALNVLRLFSLQLLNDNAFHILLSERNESQIRLNISAGMVNHTCKEDSSRFPLVIFSLFGLSFFDILYVAVVITYVSQNQLIQYYINSIIDKVRGKAYTLDDAVKEIRHTYTYLQVINGKLSTLTTLILFILVGILLSSIYNLYLFDPPPGDCRSIGFGTTVGVLNVFQWSVLVVAPIVQAARLTSHCRQLRRLGLEIGSRPRLYANTPPLDLDSFVQYASATRYTAKLASISIYPAYVIGTLFVGGVAACFIIALDSQGFKFYHWF